MVEPFVVVGGECVAVVEPFVVVGGECVAVVEPLLTKITANPDKDTFKNVSNTLPNPFNFFIPCIVQSYNILL